MKTTVKENVKEVRINGLEAGVKVIIGLTIILSCLVEVVL